MEAELVRRVLSPDATPLPRPGAVLKDFTVSGNLLFIRLTAADHRQLQLSISSCLQQLSLLMWITQCFLPVFLALLHSGQRLSPAWRPFLGRASSPRGWSLHERPLHCGGLIVCRWRRPAYMFVSVGNKSELQFRV
ncbi:cancer/testis antigen 2 [Papio anubis]|uniref:cancer/testis antigen 2 n=1 Tax=Papio anubis TaxID=9555 RepID=UPI0012AD5480|nr:cancer/testis antigen 2 [Papio anubis]